MKNIILEILKEETQQYGIYTGGGYEPSIVGFIDSEDRDTDVFLEYITDKIIKKLEEEKKI